MTEAAADKIAYTKRQIICHVVRTACLFAVTIRLCTLIVAVQTSPTSADGAAVIILCGLIGREIFWISANRGLLTKLEGDTHEHG